MATNTEHYNLVKPDKTENYDVAVQNGNMDIIDSALADSLYQTAGGTATAIILTISGTLTTGYPMTFIASANNNGVNTTINGKKFYKPATTTSPTLIAGKAYTAWYNSTGDSGNDCFFIKASAEGNTIASHVLAGDTFSNDNDTGLVGTMDLSNLVAGNIKENITINGVTGTVQVLNTDASSNCIALDSTAYTSGVVGTVKVGKRITTKFNGTVAIKYQYYQECAGDKTQVYAVVYKNGVEVGTRHNSYTDDANYSSFCTYSQIFSCSNNDYFDIYFYNSATNWTQHLYNFGAYAGVPMATIV